MALLTLFKVRTLLYIWLSVFSLAALGLAAGRINYTFTLVVTGTVLGVTERGQLRQYEPLAVLLLSAAIGSFLWSIFALVKNWYDLKTHGRSTRVASILECTAVGILWLLWAVGTILATIVWQTAFICTHQQCYILGSLLILSWTCVVGIMIVFGIVIAVAVLGRRAEATKKANKQSIV